MSTAKKCSPSPQRSQSSPSRVECLPVMDNGTFERIMDSQKKNMRRQAIEQAESMLMSFTDAAANNFANRYVCSKRNTAARHMIRTSEPDLMDQEAILSMQHAEQEALLDRIHEEEPSPEIRFATLASRKSSARRTRKSRGSSHCVSPMRMPSP